MNRRVLYVLVCLLTVFAGPCYAGLFKESGERRYMESHLAGDESELRIRTMERYFGALKKSLSAERIQTYATYIEQESTPFAVDPFLVASVMIAKSDMEWTSRSQKRYGLMRIDWDEHRKWIYRDYPNVRSLRILFKPVINIRIGARILKDDIVKNAGDVDLALERNYTWDNLSAPQEIFTHYKNLVALFREMREMQPPAPAAATPVPESK